MTGHSLDTWVRHASDARRRWRKRVAAREETRRHDEAVMSRLVRTEGPLQNARRLIDIYEAAIDEAVGLLGLGETHEASKILRAAPMASNGSPG